MTQSTKTFIAVAGNTGAGKSTLTGLVSNALGWEPFYEANAENPYLADFYDDMKRWSFHSQVYFLGKRLEHHRLLVDHPTSVIQDRTVYEDAEIFAHNLYTQGQMSPRDYQAYRSLYQAICGFLPPPDLIVYIECTVETLIKRIQTRGREFEQNISTEYLSNLNDYYDQWIDNWTDCPVLRIDGDTADFPHNAADVQAVVQMIQSTIIHS